MRLHDKKPEHFKAHVENDHASAIADHTKIKPQHQVGSS